ncbi:hypothetical protein CALCODRAFT_191002 [Calocera cornea HHB12733]|uniref:Uncharacterized protein n=1 Tax=Calocera cornea HHB12733 TaxID=1353952 RepID=A0A165HLB3_9BASI|nr:hypothetical protein CALCODRAFT_191002 [Calocera cornea HHB12733]
MGLIRLASLNWVGVENYDSGPVFPILFGASLGDSNGDTIEDYFPMLYPSTTGTDSDGNASLTAQVCRCSLAVAHRAVDVDLQSKLVISPLDRSTTSVWVYDEGPIEDDPVRDWFYGLWAFPASGTSLASLSCFESLDCPPLSLVKQYLAQVLGLHSGLQYENSTRVVSLIGLEHAMEDALSLLIWSLTMVSSDFRQSPTETAGYAQTPNPSRPIESEHDRDRCRKHDLSHPTLSRLGTGLETLGASQCTRAHV